MEWIRVDERLPDVGKEVLAGWFMKEKWTDGKPDSFIYILATYTVEGWYDDANDPVYVTHWMSRPEPPKP